VNLEDKFDHANVPLDYNCKYW